MQKNILSMKTMFLSILVLMILFVSNPAGAQSEYDILKRLTGSWRNNAGSVVLQIENGYINGCEVLEVKNIAGGGGIGAATFTIREMNAIRDIVLSWNELNKQCASLLIDEREVLHLHQDYFWENVDSVHLGASLSDVEHLWGRDYFVNDENVKNKLEKHVLTNFVYYPAKKVVLNFNYGVVDRIYILRGSTCYFAKTRINAINISSSMYGKRIIVKDDKMGEYIWYSDNGKYVELNNFAY